MNIQIEQKDCVQGLHELIQENRLANFCIVQSSKPDILSLMEKVNAQYLEQGSYEEHYIYVLQQGSESTNDIGVGSIFQIENISAEIVENMHQNGKIVCVSGTQQSEEFYK